MAPIPNQNAGALEAGYPSASQEKASLKEDTDYRADDHQQLLRPVDQTNMGSIRKMLLAMLVCLLVSFGLTTAMMPVHQRGEPCHKNNGEAQAPEAVGDQSRFTSLLGAASADSLHEILQKYFPNRYRHGVWLSEHQAMEAVHRDDAALATSMVQLAKRQDSGNNATSTTEPPPPQDSTTTPPPVTETTLVTVTETGGAVTTSTLVTVTTPPPVDTTSSQPPPPPDSTSSSDLPPTTSSESESPAPTSTSTSTTPSSTDTSPGTLTSPGPATTSSLTPAPSSTLSSKGATSSSRSSSSSSRRDTSTTSTTKSSTTETSSQSLQMITSTFTSTLSGGEVSIVTRTSFVGGNPAQSDAATSTRPSGSLQTNAADSRPNRVVEAVVGAIIGGAMLL